LATKNLATEELNVEWFISKCHTDQTIWHVAADRGIIGLLRKVWEWGKRKPNLKDNILLAQCNKWKPASKFVKKSKTIRII